MESRSNKEERGTALRREHRAAIVVEKRREDITRGGDWSEQGSESESVTLKTLETLKTLKASAIGVSAHLQVSSEQGRAPQSAPSKKYLCNESMPIIGGTAELLKLTDTGSMAVLLFLALLGVVFIVNAAEKPRSMRDKSQRAAQPKTQAAHGNGDEKSLELEEATKREAGEMGRGYRNSRRL
ncbi:unnamed protein product [[Candida] boidinii]|uniref:Unnamed protein product n=1 Tax=Candida boidinii TaxID=5477 RepID=A0ACB5TG82_CANBO|nr:unnamed protein product [[Candida] boidinii]